MSAGMIQSDHPIIKTVSESVILITSAESLLPCKATVFTDGISVSSWSLGLARIFWGVRNSAQPRR